jgi:hypothetical protein
MTTQEKERLGLALAASLVVHVIALLIVQFGDWRVAPLPEFTGPMYVEVEPLEREPADTQGLARAEAAPEAAPEAAEEAAPAEPIPPQPTPSEPAPRETPSRAEPAPEPPAAADEPRAAPSGADPLAGERRTEEFTPEDLQGTERRPGAREAPPREEEFQRLPDESATAAEATRPDWATRPRDTVEEAGISTEGVAEGEVEDLAEKVATDPAFRRALQEVTNALEQRATPDGPGSTAAPGDGQAQPEAQAPADAPSGDSRFEWVGAGNRELLNTPAVSDGFFTSADFGGSVPARTSFVVVFEVDSRGNVLPGSVIFQQGSGYVIAREKLRRRVREWTFEPAAGAEVATGIFTLVVRRDDIR